MKSGSERKSFFKAAGAMSLLIIGAVVALVYMSSIQEPVVTSTVNIARTNTLVCGDGIGPGDPGWDPDDPSRLIYIQIRPHVANAWTTYNSNQTNASAYEYGGYNTSATGSTPFGTAFDILVKVEISYNDGYNQTSSTWDLDYSWVTLTCSDLSIGANTNMSEIAIGSSGIVHQWRHYWLNNSGTGYTIVLGEQFNITSIKYWVQRPT